MNWQEVGIKDYTEVSDMYDNSHKEIEVETDFTKFNYSGLVEFETDLLWGVVEVVIIDGEFDEDFNGDLMIEVKELSLLNREGESHKHFFDPDGWEKSLCKSMIHNMKGDAVYRIKVEAWNIVCNN